MSQDKERLLAKLLQEKFPHMKPLDEKKTKFFRNGSGVFIVQKLPVYSPCHPMFLLVEVSKESFAEQGRWRVFFYPAGPPMICDEAGNPMDEESLGRWIREIEAVPIPAQVS